jgi:general secretion pathway protein G
MRVAPKARRQGGFTLIEIMVVVVILGILAAVVVPNIMGAPGKARATKAQQDIRAIESALNYYKLDNFYYPSTQQGLEALVAPPQGEPPAKNWKPGGYLPKPPVDPWGNAYQYLQPGTKGEFDLFSLGGDNKPGGDGEAADIGNWDLGG